MLQKTLEREITLLTEGCSVQETYGLLIGESGEPYTLSSQLMEPRNKNQIQWNLSKADTYGTKDFVRFREVSTLERFQLKSFQIRLFYTVRYSCFTLDPL